MKTRQERHYKATLESLCAGERNVFGDNIPPTLAAMKKRLRHMQADIDFVRKTADKVALLAAMTRERFCCNCNGAGHTGGDPLTTQCKECFGCGVEPQPCSFNDSNSPGRTTPKHETIRTVRS